MLQESPTPAPTPATFSLTWPTEIDNCPSSQNNPSSKYEKGHFRAFPKNIPIDCPYQRPSRSGNESIRVPFHIIKGNGRPPTDIGQVGSVYFSLAASMPTASVCTAITDSDVRQWRAWEFPLLKAWEDAETYQRVELFLIPFPGLIDRYFWIRDPLKARLPTYTSLNQIEGYVRDFCQHQPTISAVVSAGVNASSVPSISVAPTRKRKRQCTSYKSSDEESESRRIKAESDIISVHGSDSASASSSSDDSDAPGISQKKRTTRIMALTEEVQQLEADNQQKVIEIYNLNKQLDTLNKTLNKHALLVPPLKLENRQKDIEIENLKRQLTQSETQRKQLRAIDAASKGSSSSIGHRVSEIPKHSKFGSTSGVGPVVETTAAVSLSDGDILRRMANKLDEDKASITRHEETMAKLKREAESLKTQLIAAGDKVKNVSTLETKNGELQRQLTEAQRLLKKETESQEKLQFELNDARKLLDDARQVFSQFTQQAARFSA